MSAGAAGPVVLFPTCLVEAVRPRIGAAALRQLRRAGAVPVLAPGATCCGQPAYNAGFVPQARRVALRTLRALARLPGPVVVPSGSCATMLARHLPELLAGTRWERAAAELADRVVELSRYLADRLPPAEAPRGDPPHHPATVAFHDSCHMLRELKEAAAPRRLLAASGHELRELPGRERCCGFGGTFSVKLPAVSVAMADEKLDELVASGARRLVGCDLSCLLHLEGRARRRGLAVEVEHLAEVLG